MKRKALLLYIGYLFIIGCSSPYKKIDDKKAEKTREGIAISKQIVEKELQQFAYSNKSVYSNNKDSNKKDYNKKSNRKDYKQIEESVEKLSLVLNYLYMLWGVPEGKIDITKQFIKRWVRQTKEIIIEKRRLTEKLFLEKAKSRLAVFGSLKLLVFAISCLGLVGLCVYVRIQYGKIASFGVGIIGGAVILGYVFLVYKTYLIIGGIVIAGIFVVGLVYSLFNEVKFSKLVVNSIQRVREHLEEKDIETKKKVDSILEKHQTDKIKKKIKRIKTNIKEG